ncbi:MAG: DNA repair protein RadA [Actinomycetota bacterium]|nr:DNA repair protein RadA [Actinomycetota bacterium]
MPGKEKIVYQCQACGYSSPKWLGRCPDCGAWNTMAEERLITPRRAMGVTSSLGRARPEPLSSITSTAGKRISTKIEELDRVLGGGIVPGSVVLVGGDPGIGKSTLLLQALFSFDGTGSNNAGTENGGALYVSAEESPEQIKSRAERLGLETARANKAAQLMILSEISLEAILAAAEKLAPPALVIDSIQTIYTEELPGAPGSVGQVRDCAAKLMHFAKRSGTPVFIVGHVTKEGAIAGPRVLEHIVDTVLYFEGQRSHSFRILRTVKNRFGSTNEIGVFEMSDSGLREVTNPSEIFLAERPLDAAGSVVAASMEGTRPLLVEIQALVSPTSFGVARRSALGVDSQRVNLILAVLEKISGVHLGGMDVFLNVVGGLKIEETAVDLAVAAAAISSLREKKIPPDLFIFGEIGLSGEVRAVNNAKLRIREAAKIGLRQAVIPKANLEKIKTERNGVLRVTGVGNLNEAIEALFSSS